MKEIKLVFFEGCPNAEKVRESLTNIGIEFIEIEQNQLQSIDKYKDYSSPTILKNDEVVFGGQADGGGCSLNIPSEENIRHLLSKK